jgi:quinohemoprotein ethanol dehydrogenase
VFVGTLDGRLIALNAKTGKLVWSTVTVDQSKPYTITGAPRVAKGKVFIGNGGAEYGVRGYVSAYDAKTGKLAWRFYTVPGKRGVPDGAASDEIMAKLAGPTWFGDKYWEYGGGGTVWDAIVYDAELDQLYIGTGNASPWNHKIRSEGQGDNLFVSSILALDPDTGKYLWHYQETPGETWDYTATQQMTLTTLPVAGETRPVLLHAPKNGFFYVLDRRDGKLLSAEKFVPVNWAERIDLATGRPVEDPKARFVDEPFLSTSGAAGAHNWHPMSYDARSGVMYLPVQQIPFLYVRDQKFVFRAGEWNLGVDMMGNRLPTTPEGRAAMRSVLQGRLVAWDVKAQKEKWRVEYDRPWNGGTLATAGNLVFQGTAIGTLRAYDARDGKLLWEFDTQSSILGGPMSYAVNGEQYVAVMVGNGGGLPLTLPAFDGPRPRVPGRVMAFKLGGTAKLPPLDATLPAPNAPDEAFAPAQVEQGRVLYAQYCAACHGMETLSAGVLPDLRRSGLLTSAPAWQAVVVEGVLESRGMVSFGGKFDATAAESIRAYVGSEARAAAAAAATTPAP